MKFELITQNNLTYLSQTLFWAKKNWIKLSAIILLLFLIVKKDIKFEIYLMAPKDKKEQKEMFTSTMQASAPTQLNVAQMTTPVPVKKEIIVPEITVVSRNNLDASKFANISVLLQPSLFTTYKNQVDKLNVKKANCENYVNKFKATAIAEMQKFGIPASITLAQGLLESDAGFSTLAKRNRNHFGMKCFSRSCAKGHCSNHTDDSHKDFFRKYKSNWESYRAHSKLLQKKRYKSLHSFGTKDYKSWAHGLKKAGYATDKRYAEKLIKIIEEMKLWQYD